MNFVDIFQGQTDLTSRYVDQLRLIIKDTPVMLPTFNMDQLKIFQSTLKIPKWGFFLSVFCSWKNFETFIIFRSGKSWNENLQLLQQISLIEWQTHTNVSLLL